MSRISNKPIQLLKGFKDILPEHQKYWEFFISKAQPLLKSYGFKKIDVPVLEPTNLYYKTTGKQTDIVNKELYNFEDKGGDNVALRPEFTPSICRAYIEHGMLNKTQPVKLYSIGPVFRHDNPQAGRYRQFNQLNLEAIGSDSSVLDAQLIIIAYRLLESMGLSVIVHLNSIGCAECRPEYIIKLKQYLSSGGRKKELCENCRERYSKNTLRILDCKQEACQEVLIQSPQIVDSLCEDCKKHFMQVLEHLDDFEIKYSLNVKLVRGLDYYTRTTFEIFLVDEDINNSQGSLVGGGRYDGLIEVLGGRPTPGVGFAVGIERIIRRMRDAKVEVPDIDKVDIFVAQLGPEARKEVFKLYEKLIAEGLKVGESFSKDGLKAQLEKADALGAKISLILGQKELMDHTIIMRDMQSGIQEIVNYDRAIEEVKKRIDPNITTVKSYMLKSNAQPDETTQAEAQTDVQETKPLEEVLAEIPSEEVKKEEPKQEVKKEVEPTPEVPKELPASQPETQESTPHSDEAPVPEKPQSQSKLKKKNKELFKKDDDNFKEAENNLNNINEL